MPAMNIRILPLALLSCFCALGLSPARATDDLDLFKGTGKSPEHTYRIPSLCVTAKGTLLAFAELRRNGSGDSGDIDTVVRRSEDGGRTWSEARVMLDIDKYTIGNACPIVDPCTGRITVLAVWNRVHESQTKAGYGDDTRRVYATSSDDDGRTWSKPRDISRQVKQAGWAWMATGPGAGFVKQREPRKGRYIVGVNHSEFEAAAPGKDGKAKPRTIYYAHALYSDDAGKTWKASRTFAAPHTNECEVVELANGDLMLNMRNHGSGKRRRAVAISKDGGETWDETTWDAALPEPQCMGSIMRHSWPRDGKPGLILFCNPASDSKRANLTLRGSTDEGGTWDRSLVLAPGDAAYSHLAVLKDGTIAVAYETDGYKRISFRTVKPSELAEDAPAAEARPSTIPAFDSRPPRPRCD